MALEVQDNYLSYFFETLEVAGRLSNSLNSGFVLPQQLSQLIAVGNCLQRKIKFGITADEVTFTASLIELYSMDYKAQKAMLLETRRYFPLGLESNASSFDGSHFRLPWAATNDPTVKGLLREFAVLCGEYGGKCMFSLKVIYALQPKITFSQEILSLSQIASKSIREKLISFTGKRFIPLSLYLGQTIELKNTLNYAQTCMGC